MGKLVKLLGSGVGLAAEAMAHHKEKSRSRSPSARTELQASSSRDIPSDAPPAYEQVVEVPDERADELVKSGKAVHVDRKVPLEKGESVGEDDSESSTDDDDEAAWALDDAVEAVETPDIEQQKPKRGLDAQPTVESFAAMVMAHCPPAPQFIPQMPLPVIIPQRRPGSKDRGFVRAYSPILEGNGIPQDSFLYFLKNFHAASKASPILNVVFISAGIVGMVPSVVIMATTTAIQIAVGTAIELQKRTRTSTFLDVMNEQLFKPRGLYAIIMTYQPDAQRPVDARPMDIKDVISKWTDPEAKQWKRHLKPSSGKTYGEMELPESAPLVFPAIDEVVEAGDQEKANKMKGSMKFVSSYYDKRAQAKYASEHPDSKMDLPVNYDQPFKSKLSDPNHPAFQGGLFTLLSGGVIPPKDRRAGRRSRKDINGQKYVRNPYTPIGALKTLGNKRRMMKKGMLYLMIVNLPTEEELESARRQLQQMEQQQNANKPGMFGH